MPDYINEPTKYLKTKDFRLAFLDEATTSSSPSPDWEELRKAFPFAPVDSTMAKTKQLVLARIRGRKLLNEAK